MNSDPLKLALKVLDDCNMSRHYHKPYVRKLAHEVVRLRAVIASAADWGYFDEVSHTELVGMLRAAIGPPREDPKP